MITYEHFRTISTLLKLKAKVKQKLVEDRQAQTGKAITNMCDFLCNKQELE